MAKATSTNKKLFIQLCLIIFTFIFIIFLSACSGGGSGGGSSSATNEGSVASPITITVANAYGAMVGGSGISYYQFMAINNAQYTISLTNTYSDLSWTLFSDSNFTAFVMECDNSFNPGAADEVCSTSVPLSGSTTYYLSVDEWDNVAGKFTILVSEGP